MNYSSIEDICARIKLGDKSAFDLLFRRFYGVLKNYAYQITSDRTLADDIVQEVFFDLWIKRSTMADIKNMGAYLRTSVHNRCINYINSLKRQGQYVENINNYMELDKLHLEILQYRRDSISEKEMKDRIIKAVDGLPEQCRKVFKMSRNFNMKNAEIADNLNVSVKAVEKQMTKALHLLRNELKDFLILFPIWLFLK